MDFKQIQELIKMVNKSNIGELSIEDKEFKVFIKQKEENIQYATLPQQVPSFLPVQPTAYQSASQTSSPAADKPTDSTPATNLLTVKSPMIGTFYRRTSPDKPLLAEIGDEVAPGKVLCIIEAMKLFNEIESEVKGKIVKVLVEDASPVEYDQPLFLVDPS